MEGRESCPPPQGVVVGAKGKEKVVASSWAPLPMDKPTSLASLEMLMPDSLLF